MDPENTGKSLYLPQEIIKEILPRLPAKSLLRFRCVSKSWRCFIKAHLEESIKDPSYAHWRVLFDCYYDLYHPMTNKLTKSMTQCSLRSYLDGVYPYINRRPFDDSTNNHLTTRDCDVVGHCNGLLCIKKEGCFFVWNPTTRISVELPKLDSLDSYALITNYGFGMVEHSGAYKVFVILLEDWGEDYIGQVYSSETNSWKTVEHRVLTYGAGVLVRGKLHWLEKNGYYIESFDLSSEVFERIELPYKRGEDEFHHLRVARGMLWVVVTYYENDDDDDDDVWVRVAEGGEKEHWVKVKTDGDEESRKIVKEFGKTVYVESLVSPVPLNNH